MGNVRFQWPPSPRARSGDLQVAIVWQPKGSLYERTVFTETLMGNGSSDLR